MSLEKLETWLRRYWVLVIGALLLPIALWVVALSPFAIGFSPPGSYYLYAAVISMGLYLPVFVGCVVAANRRYRRDGDNGPWDVIPIVYFVLSALFVLTT